MLTFKTLLIFLAIISIPQLSSAQIPCDKALTDAIDDEIHPSLKYGIRYTNIRLKGNDFEVERGLAKYFNAFPFFKKILLRSLKYANAIWLNVGGGSLAAEADFFKNYGSDSAITVKSINVENPPNIQFQNIVEFLSEKNIEKNHFVLFSGRTVREISDEEIGPVTLLTDLYAAMSYSFRPDLELEKYSRLVPEGGYVFLMLKGKDGFKLRDKRLGSMIEKLGGSSFERIYNKEVKKLIEESYPLHFLDYLAHVKGFQVLHIKSYGLTGDELGIALRRNQDKFFAPSLTLDLFDDAKPPYRGYLWEASQYKINTILNKWRLFLWRI